MNYHANLRGKLYFQNPEIAFVIHKEDANLTKILFESMGRGLKKNITKMFIHFCSAKKQMDLISEIVNKKCIAYLKVNSFELTDITL